MKPKAWFKSTLNLDISDRGWTRITNILDRKSIQKKDRTLGINIADNVVHCFRTGYANSIYGFIQDYYAISKDFEAFRALELERPTKTFKHTNFASEGTVITYDELPPIESLYGAHPFCTRARNYLLKRNLDVEFLDSKGWAACVERKSKYFGRIMIPYYKFGKLTYLSGRTFMGNELKYLNLSRDVFNVSVSESIYNFDMLYSHEEVFLLEGAMDAETTKQGISTSTYSVSPIQFLEILKSPVKAIHLIPDRGFEANARKLAYKLMDHKFVFIHRLPLEFKDINQAGMENLIWGKQFKG